MYRDPFTQVCWKCTSVRWGGHSASVLGCQLQVSRVLVIGPDHSVPSFTFASRDSREMSLIIMGCAAALSSVLYEAQKDRRSSCQEACSEMDEPHYCTGNLGSWVSPRPCPVSRNTRTGSCICAKPSHFLGPPCGRRGLAVCFSVQDRDRTVEGIAGGFNSARAQGYSIFFRRAKEHWWA